MIEAAMFWNEPNDKSHGDLELDPKWELFAKMARTASEAVRGVNRSLTQVLGGMSPIDPLCVKRLESQHVLKDFDVVGCARTRAHRGKSITSPSSARAW